MIDSGDLQKAILNHIPDQAWLKDRDSRYVLVNNAFIAACRVSEDRVIGRTPADIWPEDWGRKYIDTDRRAIELGMQLRYEESRQVDGMLRWFDTIKTPVSDESGEIIGTVGISRDITDRKHAEQELQASRTQLRELSGYLQSVREEERTRIARELHDELGQALTAIRIGLDILQARRERDDDDWQGNLQSLRQMIDSTMKSVQRIAADLRPPLLDELGLATAIEWLLESFTERTQVNHRLTLPQPARTFNRDISTALFRILQESLTNISRHSQASSVDVQLSVHDHRVILKVSDNGRGLLANEPGGGPGGGLGLIGMRERAIMLGGELRIDSAEGAGTVVTVSIPDPDAPAVAADAIGRNGDER